jgi:CDP-paratose 2-epimerase
MSLRSINKVLVTGGAGFIGSYAAEHYAKKGGEVTVLDSLSRAEILGIDQKAAMHNWNYLKNNYGNVKLIKGDVRNFDEVKDATRDMEVIIHTAAQVAVTTSIKDPNTDLEVNVLGTFNVLEAARRSKQSPTIIFSSTNKVYGTNVNKIPVKEGEKRYRYADKTYTDGIPEDFPIDLCEHTPYGCSKLAGDLYAQDYAHTYGLKIGVFRMSCIYGERQFGVEDQGWVAWFTIATLLNKPLTIYGDGKQVRDVLHVSDLIEAYDAFINSNLKHEVFNMGGGPENTLSLLELLDMLEELTGKRAEVTYSHWRPGDQKVYVSNVSKAKALLNWKPKVKPREGVERLAKWVRDNSGLFLA